MKIGIDARLLEQQGPGRYVVNLLRELERQDSDNDYIIFLTKEGSELYHPNNPKFKKWVSDYKWYTLQEQFGFLIDLLRARLDLLHVPHFNVPILYPGRLVVTIHDMIMGKQDKNASTLTSFAYLIKSLGYKLVLNVGLMRARAIIVPSETVKENILKSHKLNPDKIYVTYEGVDEKLFKNKIKDMKVVTTQLEEMGIVEKYFLYVGSAYPHKNLKSLIIAFKALAEKQSFKGQFVIAGKVDYFSQRLAGFVHALKLDKAIVFVAKFSENNKITDKELAYLYMGATAYVFPSLEEGFSITPLEAQAFGVPVLLSDIPTHKEVFKDSVLYFNPKSTIDMADKMDMLMKNKEMQGDLKRRGKENVMKYSWANMAKRTLQVYKNIL